MKMSNNFEKRQIFFKNAQFTQKFDIFMKNLRKLVFFEESDENFAMASFILNRWLWIFKSLYTN